MATLLELPLPFAYRPDPESPTLGAEEGIRLAVRDLRFDGERLGFDLLLGYRFAAPYLLRFERLSDALVFAVEDAASGRASATRAIDPSRKHPYRPGPNWLGPPPPGAPGKAWDSGWLRIPCEVSPAPCSFMGPSLHVTAWLQDHQSNTIAIELVPVKASSWREGRPFEIRTYGTGPSMPPPSALPGAPSRRALTATAIPGTSSLEIRLAITAEELASGGAEAWLRSLFVTATSRDDQVPRIASWLGDRVVLDDMTIDARGGGQCVLTCDLDQVFGSPLPEGIHDVQVSARHHRSTVLEVIRP